MPGGELGLELAEDLELLRPFGMGNPQPTLLVPAARFERVTGMGEEKEHSRFTLVTAGGARSRGVAFGSPPRALAPAAEAPHDIALRLEKNRWKGVVEPRVILRALCPTEPGELRCSAKGRDFWDELRAMLAGCAGQRRRGRAERLRGGARAGRGRRGPAAARALPASRAISSPAARPLLVAVADVPRRRAGLEAVVAGLRPGRCRSSPGPTLAARPELAEGFDHLVALDPPPGGVADPLLGVTRPCAPRVGSGRGRVRDGRLRAALDLRPQLTEVYRALRELPPERLGGRPRGGPARSRPLSARRAEPAPAC